MDLQGKRVLVVEDNDLLAEQLSTLIETAGGMVFGPAPSVERAFPLAFGNELDGAVLDVRVKDGTSVPIANVLRKRQIPFFVISGLESSAVPWGMQRAPFLAKPFLGPDFLSIARQTFGLGNRNAPPLEANRRLLDLSCRLRAEMAALTGNYGSPVMLDILPRRLGASRDQVQRAAILAESNGWITRKGSAIRLTDLGRSKD